MKTLPAPSLNMVSQEHNINWLQWAKLRAPKPATD